MITHTIRHDMRYTLRMQCRLAAESGLERYRTCQTTFHLPATMQRIAATTAGKRSGNAGPAGHPMHGGSPHRASKALTAAPLGPKLSDILVDAGPRGPAIN
jgi:hypothetical protein